VQLSRQVAQPIQLFAYQPHLFSVQGPERLHHRRHGLLELVEHVLLHRGQLVHHRAKACRIERWQLGSRRNWEWQMGGSRLSRRHPTQANLKCADLQPVAVRKSRGRGEHPADADAPSPMQVDDPETPLCVQQSAMVARHFR
jgi:hypothetical protein